MMLNDADMADVAEMANMPTLRFGVTMTVSRNIHIYIYIDR